MRGLRGRTLLGVALLVLTGLGVVGFVLSGVFDIAWMQASAGRLLFAVLWGGVAVALVVAAVRAARRGAPPQGDSGRAAGEVVNDIALGRVVGEAPANDVAAYSAYPPDAGGVSDGSRRS